MVVATPRCMFIFVSRRRKGIQWSVFLLGLVLTTLVMATYVSNLGVSTKMLKSVVTQYCNPFVFNFERTGEEGPNKRNGLETVGELVQVHMIFRHGDRSPIYENPIPAVGPAPFSCRLEHCCGENTDYLRRFKQSRNRFQSSGGRHHINIVNERDRCNEGQLTSKGYLQHIALGMHLRQCYYNFTRGLNLPEDLYVKSTDYERTVQSASALLFGLFEDQLWDGSSTHINIIKDLTAGSHFLVDNFDNPLSCKPVKILAGVASRVDVLPDRLQKRLKSIYGLESGNVPSQGTIADLLYTRHCHEFPIPPGARDQLSTDDIKNMLSAADKYTVSKFTLMENFQELALLSQISKDSHRVLLEHDHAPKMVFYSGHDSVLTPFLLSLGISDGKWPPYASRLIFEIWKTDKNYDGILDIPTPTLKQLNQQVKNHYFRVMYNGVSMTHKVTFCQDHLYHNGELCPLMTMMIHVMGREVHQLDFFHQIKLKCT